MCACVCTPVAMGSAHTVKTMKSVSLFFMILLWFQVEFAAFFSSSFLLCFFSHKSLFSVSCSHLANGDYMHCNSKMIWSLSTMTMSMYSQRNEKQQHRYQSCLDGCFADSHDEHNSLVSMCFGLVGFVILFAV